LLNQFENDLLEDIPDEDENERYIVANDESIYEHELNCLEEDIITIDCGEGNDEDSIEDSDARQRIMDSLCGTFEPSSIPDSDAALQSILAHNRLNIMGITDIEIFNIEESRSFTEVIPFD